MTAVPSVTLNDGRRLPQVGLGTGGLDDRAAESAVLAAVEAGYRRFDTAASYAGEGGVGAGIRHSGLPRDQLFVTTKLHGPFQGAGRAHAGVDASLDALGLDYVDLLLIHWPLPHRDLYVSTWETFIEIAASGRARSIGVANFTPAHLGRLIESTGVAPAVNQLQIDATLAREEARAFSAAHGIVTEAWSPLGRGSAEVLGSPVLQRIARELDRTVAQVALRSLVERGLMVVPKSTRPSRMAENLALFDFRLRQSDRADIAALDRGEGAGHDSDDPAVGR